MAVTPLQAHMLPCGMVLPAALYYGHTCCLVQQPHLLSRTTGVPAVAQHWHARCCVLWPSYLLPCTTVVHQYCLVQEGEEEEAAMGHSQWPTRQQQRLTHSHACGVGWGGVGWGGGGGGGNNKNSHHSQHAKWLCPRPGPLWC